MHLGKTECILFGSKKKLKKVNLFKIKSQNQEITSKPSVKYLGVDLEQALSEATAAEGTDY